MPELPEVETIKTGLQSLVGTTIEKVSVRERRLRWPVPTKINSILQKQKILSISRRAKYLLFDCGSGTLIIHLGMSGKLNMHPKLMTPRKHDHVDIIFTNGVLLRYNDPRRFGSIHWHTGVPEEHFLLQHLGPEPLSAECNTKYLLAKAKNIRSGIKQFIMNSKYLVGVGNIYANEALFIAGISPMREAKSVSMEEFKRIVTAIKKVLKKAIKSGGTTIRDFSNASGDMGYFVQQLKVYGRGGQACTACSNELVEIRLGQRSTVYCDKCQS